MTDARGLYSFALLACAALVALAITYTLAWGPYVGACQLPTSPQASPAVSRYYAK